MESKLSVDDDNDDDDEEEKDLSQTKSQFANFSVLSLLARPKPDKEKGKLSQGGDCSLDERNLYSKVEYSERREGEAGGGETTDLFSQVWMEGVFSGGL